MIGKQLIPILLIIATTSIHRMLCDSTEELLSNNNVTDAFDVTEPATTMQPEEIDSDENLDAPATTETLPDLILAENVRIRSNNNNAEQFFDDKNTAKRTISSRFTGPIIVNDEENLFTPADEIIGRQINVQILEPDPHNNGQFLKQTVYTKTENNTVFSTKTTTTTTTERPTNRRKNIVATRIASSRYVPPLAGPTVSNCPGAVSGCSSTTDRATVVTEGTARKVQNVDINQSVQVKRVIIEEPSKQYLPFGTRFTSTTKSPCQLASAPSPCSSTARTYSPTPTTPRVYSPTTSRVYSSTPTTVRVRPLNSTPLIPRVYTTPTPIVSTATVTSVPIHSTTTTIVPEPIIIHRVTEVPTVRIVEKPVTVEKVVKEFVNVPGPTVEKIVPYEVEKVVVKEVKVPVNTVIEKHINHPPQFVEKFVPYPVHNVVQAKPIEIPRIIHKEVHVPVPVDRIVEKPVPYQVDHVVEKFIDRPVPVEKIVEKPVPVPYVVEKPVHIPIQVGVPIHVPYLVPIEVHSTVPYPVHVPYLLKQTLQPPPLQKQHFIIKTTKYGKGHGFFDWKHSHPKYIKHIYVKKPHTILIDELLAPPTIDSIGLLPPPRFQSVYGYEHFAGPTASASINVYQAVLPNTPSAKSREPFQPSPLQNGFGNYESKHRDNRDNKFAESIAKDIRWEFGFKPPLVPSMAIDEFGNPLHAE